MPSKTSRIVVRVVATAALAVLLGLSPVVAWNQQHTGSNIEDSSSSTPIIRWTNAQQRTNSGARRNHHDHHPAPRSQRHSVRQRRRRAMDNNNNNNNRRQGNRYQQGHNNNNKQYQYTEEERRRHRQTETTLSDVWLCLCFALGWSVWFLSTFLNTDLMRFAKQNNESVMTVHGNVREVSIEECDMGTGIPSYSALIDYMVTVRDRTSISTIQVRKQFQTQHLLQQGFANVELLVLPEEPTSSVLKEDWQREVAAKEQAEEDLTSIELGELGAVVVGGTGLNYNDLESADNLREGSGSIRAVSSRVGSVEQHRFDILTRRASLVFSGLLVSMSLIGAVMAVHHMPSKHQQMWGWASLVVGSVFLWPAAMFTLNLVQVVQRLGRLPTEKSGIILSCNTNAQEGTTLNDDTEGHYKAHDEVAQNKNGAVNVNNADVMRTVGSKDAGGSVQKQKPNSQNEAADTGVDDSQCYFVKLPSGKQRRDGELVKADDLSVSTISNYSAASNQRE